MKLTKAGRIMEQQGYEVVGFIEPAADDDHQIIYLRADRLEHHTPGSLFARNAELYQLADDFGLKGYDGMDVGACDGP